MTTADKLKNLAFSTDLDWWKYLLSLYVEYSRAKDYELFRFADGSQFKLKRERR